MSFETIKRNFDRGLWSKGMVKTAVRKGVITAAQYEEITGEVYSPDQDAPTNGELLDAILGV